MSLDVISVPSEMKFTDESRRKAGPELTRDKGGVEIIGIYVGGEKRRCFEEDNVLRCNERFKIVDDGCLYVFCLCWRACMSVIGVSGVIGECVNDDDVFVGECGLLDCVECLCKSECGVGDKVEVRERFVE